MSKQQDTIRLEVTREKASLILKISLSSLDDKDSNYDDEEQRRIKHFNAHPKWWNKSSPGGLI